MAVYEQSGKSYQRRFEELSRSRREDVVLNGFKGVERFVPNKRMREDCPEVVSRLPGTQEWYREQIRGPQTLVGLCSGRGEEFAKLVKHFTVPIEEIGSKTQDYPVSVHKELWRRLEIEEEAGLVPKSRGQRAF